MSKSLFSDINGFNETAIQNIEETDDIFFDLDYENDFTSDKNERKEDDEVNSVFDFIPFEEDIILA